MTHRGVDINATADDGGTALHVACAWGCHEVVKQLLEVRAESANARRFEQLCWMQAGADRFILNKESHSALQEVCRGTKTTTESKNMIQDAFKNVYVV